MNKSIRFLMEDFPCFYGDNLEEWIQRCNQLFLMEETPERLKQRWAIVCLEGDAREWHKSFLRDNGDVIDELHWMDYLIMVFKDFESAPKVFDETPSVIQESIKGDVVESNEGNESETGYTEFDHVDEESIQDDLVSMDLFKATETHGNDALNNNIERNGSNFGSLLLKQFSLKDSIDCVFDVGKLLVKKNICLECTQDQNGKNLIPSRWYHQVHNTISINYNWFNADNLFWEWDLMLRDYKEAREYIEDIKDICDDFEGPGQQNLAADTNSDMISYEFCNFMVRVSFANFIRLHVQLLGVDSIVFETFDWKPDWKFCLVQNQKESLYNSTECNVTKSLIARNKFATKECCLLRQLYWEAVRDAMQEDVFVFTLLSKILCLLGMIFKSLAHMMSTKPVFEDTCSCQILKGLRHEQTKSSVISINGGHEIAHEYLLGYKMVMCSGGEGSSKLKAIFDTIIEAFLILDKNGDGKLNKKDMIKVMNEDFPMEKSPTLITKTRFKEMDWNKDGKVSFRESLCSLVEQGWNQQANKQALQLIRRMGHMNFVIMCTIERNLQFSILIVELFGHIRNLIRMMLHKTFHNLVLIVLISKNFFYIC